MKSVLTLLLAVAPLAAQAQAPSVVTRDSLLSGNFQLGFATLGDSGSDRQQATTPDASFYNLISDSGGVDGLFGDTPVSGSASFGSTQSYAVGTDRVDFGGEASSAVATPYPWVSVGATALSQLDLLLHLPVPMAYTLEIDVFEQPGATVNGLTPRADALVKLSGPGDVWLFNETGSFQQSGVLAAGDWRINAFADTRGNGYASFLGFVQLAPVPEPGGLALLVAGVGVLLLRQRALDRILTGVR
jgi:opacity protein-like surface antigen